jgi:hypothetical protein
MIGRIAIAAIATAALAGFPAARSDDAWRTTVKCASGAFTSQKPGVDDQGRPATWLNGWIRPCTEPGAGDRFGVIYYTGTPVDGEVRGYVHLARLRGYDDGGAATPLSGTIDRGLAGSGPLLALCLAYDDGGLVACVAADHEITGSAPPPMDLLDRAPVTQLPGGKETHPNCGTCL